MANNKSVYQQVENVSINRKKLLEIAEDIEYNKTDYKVFLVLLSQLDGYVMPKTESERKSRPDPLNFKIIDISAMSDLLNISKKDIKKSIKKLHSDGVIEEGGNNTIKSGYRFSF